MPSAVGANCRGCLRHGILLSWFMLTNFVSVLKHMCFRNYKRYITANSIATEPKLCQERTPYRNISSHVSVVIEVHISLVLYPLNYIMYYAAATNRSHEKL